MGLRLFVGVEVARPGLGGAWHGRSELPALEAFRARSEEDAVPHIVRGLAM